MDIRIVTLATENIMPYAGKAIELMNKYAEKHGYKLTVYKNPILEDRPASYSKGEAILHELKTGADYCVWIDSDCYIMNSDARIEDFINDKKILFGSDSYGLNAGFMIFPNCIDSVRLCNFITDASWPHYTPHWDQDCIKIFLNANNYIDYGLLEQRLCNSYTNNFTSGDFILHLAGTTFEERVNFATNELGRFKFTTK